MRFTVKVLLGPVAVEVTGLQFCEASDLEALEPYLTIREAEFRIELTDGPPAGCESLSRDTSVFDAAGEVLCMRYASWVTAMDLTARTASAYLPNRGLFDNFLRTMTQIIPLALGAGVAMHAASLTVDGQAVILAAPSCTGKSVAAVRGLGFGLELLAEDVTVIGGFDQGRPSVYTTPLRNHCGVVAGPQIVPLGRVYGLRRGTVDRVVGLDASDAMGVLRENLAVGTRQSGLGLRALEYGKVLVEQVGVRALECTLNGSYWFEIMHDLAADRRDFAETT